MTDVDGVSKYRNGKIYRIWNTANDKIYVGSTIQPLHRRMIGHRCDARKPECPKVKLCEDMNTLGHENFKIQLIEYYPCQTKDELTRREGELIRELKPDLNMQIAERTGKEWVRDNQNRIREKQREYIVRNKDKLTEKQREYFEKNRDHFLNYKKTMV